LPLHEEQQLNLLGEKTIANRENLYSFVEEKKKISILDENRTKIGHICAPKLARAALSIGDDVSHIS